MRNHILTIGLSVAFLGAIATSLAIAETSPTMNQPDNGFFEGANPEWATLHSTNSHGTAEHRQYHRDAVQSHLLWHTQNRSEQGTVAYENAHRIFHQERNTDHRYFHNAPANP